MKIGARDTDSYLAEWRKAPIGDVEGEPDTIAATRRGNSSANSGMKPICAPRNASA